MALLAILRQSAESIRADFSQNFLGEKNPREVDVKEQVTISIEGQEVKIESVNKEQAGNMAGALERLTRRTAYDRRIFQDGIYIIDKEGKAIS